MVVKTDKRKHTQRHTNMVKFFPNLTPEHKSAYLSDIPYPFEIPSEKIPPILKHTYNNATFHYMIWPSLLPNDETKARLIFVHGFGEYTKFYYRIMYDLSLQGIECFFFDQRGSGYTSPYNLKGVTNFTYQIDDLHYFIDFYLADVVKRENEDEDEEETKSGIKNYLFGHSMGGQIILNYGFLEKRDKRISGIVCTGPLIKTHPTTEPGFLLVQLMKFLARTKPDFKVDMDLDIDGLTDDEDVKKWLLNDYPWTTPCVGTIEMLYNMYYNGLRLIDTKTKNNTQLFVNDESIKNFPSKLLILHGQEDTINFWKASQIFVNDVMTDAKCKENSIDKKLVLLPKGKHSLALCSDRDNVYSDTINEILSFLN